MAFTLFAIAGLLAGILLFVHLFLGGAQIANPLLTADDLPVVVRETQYLCWHFTSVGIAAQALFFGLAALTGDAGLALAGTALATGFAVTGVGLVIARGQDHALLPQGWLFVPIALLGGAGLAL